ncbi:hypothetical protein B0192_04535 [Leptospira interrogans serovar Australis]|nr:hypothetical protein B0192_04535 [Leptospira interrogans serovar Australis]
MKNETINQNKLHQVGIGHSKLKNNRFVENSIIDISKTVSMIHFNATDTNGELIFQQLYYINSEVSTIFSLKQSVK